ncbi:MFS transporter [Arthrobacter globiformis]|uniref:MFS transporter n=1 Tax=Arthrobacter globiformis TaxID=1665 RepID=UPI003593DAFF
MLTFSAFQLFSGTLSDRVGARRAFGVGVCVFMGASAACGLAPSLPFLVAGRILQGPGGGHDYPELTFIDS